MFIVQRGQGGREREREGGGGGWREGGELIALLYMHMYAYPQPSILHESTWLQGVGTLVQEHPLLMTHVTERPSPSLHRVHLEVRY